MMSDTKPFEHLKIQLEAILSATNNFADDHLIGKGAFGKVYRGELIHSKGHTTVALKRLDRPFGEGDVEFWNEIRMLSLYSHENIASLIGYCTDGGQKILVYKYSAKRSVESHLGSKNLTWVQRLKICIEAARGLAYLHQGRIVHRDVKSSNILLDENWTAKINDFGLSKIGLDIQPSTFLVPHPVGSLAYIDPQYYETGKLTKASDVYSFGVVLFEVLCGRLAINKNDKHQPFTKWVRECYTKNKVHEIIYEDIKVEMNPRTLEEFTTIAYQCLSYDLKQRPTMKEVVEKLESALEYQIIETMSFPEEFEDLKIQLEAILLATNYFSEENCIGEGGFGKVYKGKLLHSKGHITVALKRLDCTFQQGDLEFWKEMIMLSLYRHENIVPLLGFCDDRGEKIIVYKYASRSGLDLYLDSNDLTWDRRLKICIGAARGLAYLHSDVGTNRTVLHRDIKSSNIVLDETWNAKIADVGLSKFGRPNQQYKYLVDNVVGTVGYCDPVYFETGLLTKESDVYSFGVVLFEVLCGRLCLGQNDKHQSFTVLVRKCYKRNNLNEIIYGNIKDEIHPSSLEVFTRIGYQCLKRSREERPLMKEIVRILETALQYQVPPLPPPQHIPTSSPSSSKSGNVSHLPDKRSLKPLHWEKTHATVGSIWDLPHKQGNLSRVPEIDKKELESLFSEG